MVKVDPTISVKNPPRKKGAGFRPWTEDDVAAYERRWPIGTRQRVWLDVLLYTGLRRGDAVRLGRQHVRDGVASIKTEKSGFTVTVTLPILDALARDSCSRTMRRPDVHCRRERPSADERVFRQSLPQGMPNCGRSWFGARRPQDCGDQVGECGATVAQLEAIFGWQGGTMACSLYAGGGPTPPLAGGNAHA